MNQSNTPAQQAANLQVVERDAAVQRFIDNAAASDINLDQSSFADVRYVREGVVFKEGRVRDMDNGSGAFKPVNSNDVTWSLRSDTNLNYDQNQTDRSIIVRGIGLMINPDADIADLEKILEFGQVTVSSPNSDYPDWNPPLEDLIINPIIQTSQTSNQTASAAGTGINAYEFLRSRGQGKFNALPQPLLVKKNSKCTLRITGINGETLAGDLTLQMVLVCDYPII